MFNHHFLIPWGSFRGRQEEKWGSFRGWDHFGVDLGIISGLGIISDFGGCTVTLKEDKTFLCVWLLYYLYYVSNFADSQLKVPRY